MLDRLIEALVVPGRYLSLKEITIAGHSAGGQFVQRYAAGTTIEQRPSVSARSLAFRYVAANPSSYLYLFPRQPDRTTQDCPRWSCLHGPLGASGPEHCCNSLHFRNSERNTITK